MNPAAILAGWGAVAYFLLWRPLLHADQPAAYRATWFVYGVYLAGVWYRLSTGVPVDAADWAIVAAGLVAAVVWRAEPVAHSGPGLVLVAAGLLVLVVFNGDAVQQAHATAWGNPVVGDPAVLADGPWTAGWWADAVRR